MRLELQLDETLFWFSCIDLGEQQFILCNKYYCHGYHQAETRRKLVAMALFSSAGGARGPGSQIGLCVGLNGVCLAPRLSWSTPNPYSVAARNIGLEGPRSPDNPPTRRVSARCIA